MKKAKKNPITKLSSAKQDDKALKHILETKTAALEHFVRLSKPLEEAVEVELAATKGGKELVRNYKEMAAKVAATWQLVAEKKLSRPAAWSMIAPNLHALQDRMRVPLQAAYAKHAALLPNHRTIIEALHGREALEMNWVAEISWLPIFIVTLAAQPGDVGVIQQGLGDPAPFGFCQSPAFALQETRTESQLLGIPMAISSPGSGNFFSTAFADLAGGSAARALVGDNFAVPQGYTNFEVTADIDWSYDGWTYTVGGGAGVGADLLLVIDRADGSPRLEVSQPQFSLVSPVIWGNSASGTGTSTISAKFAVDTNDARTLKIFAGGSCHAECVPGVTSGANVTHSGMVTKICVNAT